MKNVPNRSLILCLAIVLLSACKIEIPPVAGGVVQSDSGTYQCLPGNSCIIEVSDTEFDENFRAVPLEGYAFRGWGEGLCRGSQKSCALYTTSFGDNPSLGSVLGSDRSFSLSPVFEYVGDGSGQQAFLVDEDNSGISNMILHPEGASLTVAKAESGDIWAEIRFVDGESALLRSDANGVPLELYYGDTALVFLEFTSQQAKLGLALGDGSRFLTTLALDDSTLALLPEGANTKTVNTASITATPARSLSPASKLTTTQMQDDNTEKPVTASEWIIKASDAVTIAAQIVANRSLSPLFGALADDQKRRIIDEIKKELTNRPQSTTTAKLQTSIMVNGGQCAITIGTGGAVALLTSADACKKLTRGAFLLTQQWAIKVRSDIGIDRLEAQGVAIKPDELEVQVTNRLTARDEAIARYKPEITFLSPRASASHVGPDPTVTVKVRDALNPLTINKLSLYVDERIATNHLLGVPIGPARLVYRPDPSGDDDSSLEGNNYFYLRGLTPGAHTLLVSAKVRGSAPAKDVYFRVALPMTVCEFGANESGTDCEGGAAPDLNMTVKTANSVITSSNCPDAPLGYSYTFTDTTMTLTGTDGTQAGCIANPQETFSVPMTSLASNFDIPFNCESYPICTTTDLNKTITGIDQDSRNFTSTYAFNPVSNILTYTKSVDGGTFTEVIIISN